MLITIGAPIKEVIILIGKLPEGNNCAIHENNNIRKTPNNMTKRKSSIICVLLKTIRQMCGTANPMNATGPTNAVADAVNIADEINISHLVFLMLMPMVCA